MEYSIKKLPLKALKWAQFARASHAHLAFTISFMSYQDWTTYIDFITQPYIHIQTLCHFPHMMFF